MHSRYIFAFTLLVSLSVHSAILFNFKDDLLAASNPAVKPEVQKTRVVFTQIAKAVPVPEVIPRPVKKPPVKKIKKKPLKKIVKKKPEIIPKKIKQVKPVEKKIVQQIKPIPAVVSAPQVLPKKQRPIDKIVTQVLADDEKQRYKAKLLAHIESHKFYPGSARKRGIQGDVSVSFVLSPDGSIVQVKVKGGPRMLRKAAQKSINASLPLPKPPKLLSKPMPVKYKMAFALNNL